MGLEVDSKCLAYHGPLLYEAKVLMVHDRNSEEIKTKTGTEPIDPETFNKENVDKQMYFIHYRGWKASWDEWVNEDRVLTYDEENLRKQKELKAALTTKSAPTGKREREKTVDRTMERAEKTKPAQKRAYTKRAKAEDRTVETEDEFLKRPEVSLSIPDNLKSLLVDDWELVTKNKQLVKLPVETSVADVLAEYKHVALKGKQPQSAAYDNTIELLNGLKAYFDRCLGSILLYQLERRQLLDQTNMPINKGKQPSEIYGVEHLLRLLVTLPGLIAQTSMDQQSVQVMRDFVERLLKWLDAKAKAGDFFTKDYENISPAYEALARS